MTKSETETEKNKWVLYHADCMDGYAAAWAAWNALGDSARYKPVKHHEPMPALPADIELYILDFCYPLEVLVSTAQRVNKIVVLDHHISAQKDYESYLSHASIPENLELQFIQHHSGCIIAWHYFQANQGAPLLLQHIEDNDLWLHKLNNTDAICKALCLQLPVDFSAFDKINLSTLEHEGAVLLKQQKINVQRLLKIRHKINLNGVDGLAVNAPTTFSSDLGHALAELSGTFGLTYQWNGKYQRYDCGIRSIGEFDVSTLAKRFGGGGHKNASGFTLDQAALLDSI